MRKPQLVKVDTSASVGSADVFSESQTVDNGNPGYRDNGNFSVASAVSESLGRAIKSAQTSSADLSTFSFRASANVIDDE